MQQAKLAGPHVPGVRAKESCFLHACFCTKLIPYQPQGAVPRLRPMAEAQGTKFPGSSGGFLGVQPQQAAAW